MHTLPPPSIDLFVIFYLVQKRLLRYSCFSLMVYDDIPKLGEGA